MSWYKVHWYLCLKALTYFQLIWYALSSSIPNTLGESYHHLEQRVAETIRTNKESKLVVMNCFFQLFQWACHHWKQCLVLTSNACLKIRNYTNNRKNSNVYLEFENFNCISLRVKKWSLKIVRATGWAI